MMTTIITRMSALIMIVTRGCSIEGQRGELGGPSRAVFLGFRGTEPFLYVVFSAPADVTFKKVV